MIFFKKKSSFHSEKKRLSVVVSYILVMCVYTVESIMADMGNL